MAGTRTDRPKATYLPRVRWRPVEKSRGSDEDTAVRRLSLVVTLALTAAVLSGCTGKRAEPTTPDPVTIALAAAPSDVEALNGARLAVEIVNDPLPDLPL